MSLFAFSKKFEAGKDKTKIDNVTLLRRQKRTKHSRTVLSAFDIFQRPDRLSAKISRADLSRFVRRVDYAIHCINLYQVESGFIKPGQKYKGFEILSNDCKIHIWVPENYTLFYKNVVFPAQAEYSYFSADFRLKIFLYYS